MGAFNVRRDDHYWHRQLEDHATPSWGFHQQLEASTMFGLIKLNLLISTTNNPPRRNDLGDSPRIHQAFHRKFTVHQGKPGPGPHVHSTARSAVSCRGIGSRGDASDVTGVRMGFNTRVVIHDLDELGYPIWRNPMKFPYLKFKI